MQPYPISTSHVAEHPLPETPSPSSHFSPKFKIPFLHFISKQPSKSSSYSYPAIHLVHLSAVLPVHFAQPSEHFKHVEHL